MKIAVAVDPCWILDVLEFLGLDSYQEKQSKADLDRWDTVFLNVVVVVEDTGNVA